MMSQAIRRAGRLPLAMPTFGVRAADSVRKATTNSEVNRDQLDYHRYGRVMDTTRMRAELGFEPKWTTLEAFDDFVRGRGLTPIIDPGWVRSVESRALALAQRWGGVASERRGI
jgi:UDP-glucose 4-epimerase